jgi:hypothetical protein
MGAFTQHPCRTPTTSIIHQLLIKLWSSQEHHIGSLWTSYRGMSSCHTQTKKSISLVLDFYLSLNDINNLPTTMIGDSHPSQLYTNNLMSHKGRFPSAKYPRDYLDDFI